MPLLDSFTPDNLFAGNVQPVVTEVITVAADQNLVKGAVFELDLNGNAVVPTGAPIEPSKVYGIMSETVITAVGETKPSVAYMTGEFNKNSLVFPDGTTVSDYKVPLRKIGIFLK